MSYAGRPPERRREMSPAEKRCAAAQPDRSNTRVVTCRSCGAWWQDNEPGRDAHLVVFGHLPARHQRPGDDE